MCFVHAQSHNTSFCAHSTESVGAMSGAAGNESQSSRVDDITDSDRDSDPEGGHLQHHPILRFVFVP